MINKVILSDTHLGSIFTRVDLLISFLDALKKEGVDELDLNGDIFDIWKDPLEEKYNSLFQDFKKITYITGNHDNITNVLNNLNVNAIKMYSDMNMIIMHGHQFDVGIGRDTVLSVILDRLEYELSKMLNFHIREWLRGISVYFYKDYNKKPKNFIADSMQKFLIIGHTHIPFAYEENGKYVFNLGSWYDQPYAFFIKDDKYCYHKIESNHLLPFDYEYRKM